MSIQTFTLTLSRQHALTVKALETSIIEHLSDCKRLLRWAIVSYTDRDFAIEGAYLSLA